jgi:hypothetical protein
LRYADAVGCVEFKTVVALNAVCFVDCALLAYKVYHTHCAVSNLALAVCEVLSCGHASLLSTRHCQVKATHTLVTYVILQTYVTIRDVT